MEFEKHRKEFEEHKKDFISQEFKGAIPTDLEQCVQLAVSKAYRDMTPRTIKGHTETIKKESCDYLQKWFKEYLEKNPLQKEEDFDEMYYSLCGYFLDNFNEALRNKHLTPQKFGKAQKIINMTFKYLYCLLPKKKDWFTYCHMPLDTYTLNWYYRQSKNKPGRETWSNLEEGCYDEISKEIRALIAGGEYAGLSPLEAEFIIWDEEKNKVMLKELRSVLKKCLKNPLFKTYKKKLQELENLLNIEMKNQEI